MVCKPYASCYFCGEDHEIDSCEESDFISNIEQEEFEIHKTLNSKIFCVNSWGPNV